MSAPLACWNDTSARQAIVDFVERLTREPVKIWNRVGGGPRSASRTRATVFADIGR